MIDVAINHIASQLNQYLLRRKDVPQKEQRVTVTSNVVELDGTVSPQNNNKVIISLVNVEKDTAPRQLPRDKSGGNSRIVQTAPALYLNLYLLMAGNWPGENYPESLKYLSEVIRFFHRRPVFDHATSPDLHPQIERLTLELANLDIQELSNLWGVIGGKYLPSVLYKIRMIAIESDDVIEQTPAISRPQSGVST